MTAETKPARAKLSAGAQMVLDGAEERWNVAISKRAAEKVAALVLEADPELDTAHAASWAVEQLGIGLKSPRFKALWAVAYSSLQKAVQQDESDLQEADLLEIYRRAEIETSSLKAENAYSAKGPHWLQG